MGLLKMFGRRSGSADQEGQLGPYYLQELINSGGMADIWLATNAEKEVLALRRLHADKRGDAVSRKRFVRGCEVLAAVQGHPYIIGYHDHGKLEGDLFLAMEYMEASNLKQLLARVDPILVENVANILIDLSEALEHVHERGYMHMDFKPENVLVSRNASLRLIDFDLSIPRQAHPFKLSENPGTPAYMAPEQLRRQPIDQRVDIFGFGVTAYEVLTLRKPFPGESAKEVLAKQIESRSSGVIAPREVNPDIPPGLEKIVLKCLEWDPDKRYPFMSVVVRDLKRALYVG